MHGFLCWVCCVVSIWQIHLLPRVGQCVLEDPLPRSCKEMTHRLKFTCDLNGSGRLKVMLGPLCYSFFSP